MKRYREQLIQELLKQCPAEHYYDLVDVIEESSLDQLRQYLADFTDDLGGDEVGMWCIEP